MIGTILWVVLAVALLTFAVYREIRKAKKAKEQLPDVQVHREKTEREKQTENEIAIERERSRRSPGGPYGGGWV